MKDRPIFENNRFLNERPNDPYAQGQQAFCDGKKLKDCPYQGKDAMKWRNGWWFEQDKATPV